ncbi:MAG: DNA primase [Chloroflexi bacterium]|nr:DNA primase [Chloroflexota bacterium]
MPSPVEEIKERLDIVELVSPYVALKKSGKSYKGLCPFHTEKTPSFYVFPDKGNYHCFGCGANGDIFTFLMKTENLEFPEALRTLAERTGVVLVPRQVTAAEDQARERLRQINAAAAQFYHNLLLNSSQAQGARDYLVRRGVNAETIVSWELGYALDQWTVLLDHLTGRGYALDELAAAGLVVEKDHLTGRGGGHYDRFRHRLIFPIRDQKGNVTGFGGRALGDEEPKYLNSPQTLIFDKSGSLYGIHQAREAIRRAQQAIIVEGYMDVLIAHQMGINTVVASLGTALTDKQVSILKKLTTNLVLALDADVAGDEATLRGLEVARGALDYKAIPVPTWKGLVRFEYKLDANIHILSLPRGKDPDEVMLESRQLWQELVDGAEPVVDFYFRAVAGRHDLSRPKEKAQAVEELVTIIREIGDPVVESHYVQRLAQLVGVEEKVIASALARAKRVRRPAGAGEELLSLLAPAAQSEEYCLALLLQAPGILAERPDLAPEDFTDPENRQIFEILRGFAYRGEMPAPEVLRERIDQALLPRVGVLIQRSASLPPAEDEQLRAGFVDCVRTLRRYGLREREAQLGALLAEAEEDPEERAHLQRMVNLLLLEEMELLLEDPSLQANPEEGERIAGQIANLRRQLQ